MQMIMWQSTEVAHLPGIINILISWMIWVTSIPSIRFKNFELFYYSHYLYILFIVFLAMHIGNFLLCIVAGPILLFIIDYFLRLFQSQKCVDVISTTSFPCDVVELVMPITQSNVPHYSFQTHISLNALTPSINHICTHYYSCSFWTSYVWIDMI